MTETMKALAEKMASEHCNGWGESVYLAGFEARDGMVNDFELLKEKLLKSGAKSEYIQAAIVLVRTCLLPESSITKIESKNTNSI